MRANTRPLTVTAATTSIYALCDPDTGAVRYVGKADDARARYLRHLGPQELGAETHKARWIRELLTIGKRPTLRVLECIPKIGWQSTERRWIAELRAKGAPLTNITDGGDGRQKGLRHTPAAIAKIVASLIGRPVSVATREKLRRRFAGVLLSDDHKKSLSDAGRKRWGAMSDADKIGKSAALRHGWSAASRAKVGAAHRGKKPNRPSSTPFVGVSRFKRDGNWRAYAVSAGRQVHLGYFATPEAAARAYDAYILATRGEFARPNFPVDGKV